MKPLRVTAAVLTAVLLISACSGQTNDAKAANPAPTDGTLTVGLLGDIGQPPDPDIYYANNGLAIVLNTYEGLVQYEDNLDTVKIAPRLATSWEVSADKKVYTFHLRDGVKFHDGTAFTSEAVKVSLQRRTDVKGGAAYMTAGVQSVDTSDPSTAVVTLKEGNAAFLDYLASPFGPKMISPDGLARNKGSDDAQTYLTTHDIGSGPYSLSAVQTGTKYELTQFDGYWGTRSPFTKVELPVYNDSSALELAFDKGDVSAIVAALPSSDLKKYENSAAADSYLLPTLQSALVTLNPSGSFFKTAQARLAFLQSLDREKLIPQVLGNRSELATTLYAKGMIPDGADKQNITYNPEAMKTYAATLPAGSTMTIGYATGNPNAQQLATIVAAQMATLNIKATAQGYPTAQVFDWVNDPAKGPDAFFDGNNGPDGGNPYMWGHVFWDKSGGINYFACDDPSVDADLDKAVLTGDNALFVSAAEKYAASGCYLNFSYNKDWVVAQKWLTGVAESHNIGANELNFAKLGIKG
ncbi:ABC transporter substrate-binding protein [Actinoplanes sp. NPDC026619]|uniref:ABC transporter substrate-binding protein n=1 Tax=Actinoplanes sp. NPDC026619 TaxID=3155798 RepID=UPI0033D5D70A